MCHVLTMCPCLYLIDCENCLGFFYQKYISLSGSSCMSGGPHTARERNIKQGEHIEGRDGILKSKIYVLVGYISQHSGHDQSFSKISIHLTSLQAVPKTCD